MSLETDAVPRPMDEAFAITLGGDPVARHGVDRLAGDPRADGPRRRLLRTEQHAEEVPEPLVGTARRVPAGHPERSGDVRAVAAQRAPDVEHDRLAWLDDPLGCLVMRRGGVRAGGDDGKRG